MCIRDSSEDLLPPHRARAVYWSVRRHLLTPFGLRTLDARDPRYLGRCEGTQKKRDRAYHQGTVWPWLLGPLADVRPQRGEPAPRGAHRLERAAEDPEVRVHERPQEP